MQKFRNNIFPIPESYYRLPLISIIGGGWSTARAYSCLHLALGSTAAWWVLEAPFFFFANIIVNEEIFKIVTF